MGFLLLSNPRHQTESKVDQTPQQEISQTQDNAQESFIESTFVDDPGIVKLVSSYLSDKELQSSSSTEKLQDDLARIRNCRKQIAQVRRRLNKVCGRLIGELQDRGLDLDLSTDIVEPFNSSLNLPPKRKKAFDKNRSETVIIPETQQRIPETPIEDPFVSEVIPSAQTTQFVSQTSSKSCPDFSRGSSTALAVDYTLAELFEGLEVDSETLDAMSTTTALAVLQTAKLDDICRALEQAVDRKQLAHRDVHEIRFVLHVAKTFMTLDSKNSLSSMNWEKPELEPVRRRIVFYGFVLRYGWQRALQWLRQLESEEIGLPEFSAPRSLQFVGDDLFLKAWETGASSSSHRKNFHNKRDPAGKFIKKSPRTRPLSFISPPSGKKPANSRKK